MGNKHSKAPGAAAPTSLLSFEYVTGKLLLAALRKDSEEALLAAIETARKEFVQPINGKTSNSSDFRDMVECLTRYLTKPYDIGEGFLFPLTPLEYCAKLKSSKCETIIRKKIKDLQKQQGSDCTQQGRKVKQGSGDASLRAEEAKERLQRFQKEYKSPSK